MNVRIPCQTLVSGFWQFPIVLYAFLTFPLPLWSSVEETFFSMWSQAEVKIWWIAFITSSGGTAAGIFCMKKSKSHLNEEEILAWKKASWFLARKFKQFCYEFCSLRSQCFKIRLFECFCCDSRKYSKHVEILESQTRMPLKDSQRAKKIETQSKVSA